MFDHVLIRVADRARAEEVYRAALAPFGVEAFEPLEGITRFDNLGITQADGEHPVTRNVHIGFAAPTQELADAFDDGILRDLDGTTVEAVHGDPHPTSGLIDRLELRVADLTASRAFYTAIAPHTGYEPVDDATFRGDGGQLSLVADTQAPTQHLHFAFSAPDEQTVTAFHLTATNAGYADNGAPGQRPVYGDGYFGAFVLDPDGNNVEAVHMPS